MSRFTVFERHVQVNLRTIKSRFAIFQMYSILHSSRDFSSKYFNGKIQKDRRTFTDTNWKLGFYTKRKKAQ
jgi:hypothetical protein